MPDFLENREGKLAGDFGMELDLGIENPVAVYFGATHRNERYTIGQGDEASWEAGPLTNLFIGSNGFASFLSEGSGNWTDRNTAGYIDV